jgi:hypothetical protein
MKDDVTEENRSDAGKRKGRTAEGKFAKGTSGNPNGRPKTLPELREKIQLRGDDLVDTLFDIMDDMPEWVGEDGKRGGKIVGPSNGERIAAIKLLKAYGYGLPKQTVEVSGPGGGPVQSEVATKDLSEMTTGELRRYLEQLRKKHRREKR